MKAKFLNTLYDYLFLIGGVLLYTISWGCFMIPNGMSSGGLTGLCTILQMLTGGKITVGVSYAAFNVVLLLIGFSILGKGFGIKTIFCIALSSVLLELWAHLPVAQALPGNFLFVPEKPLVPIISGLCEAIGVQMIFTHGGSTGGTDIVALITSKYWPITPGKLFMYIDLFIIACILFVPGRTFSDMIYGYIMMFTFSMTLDLIMMGRQSSVKLLVFSDKDEEIAEFIGNNMKRGVTILKARGWYTQSDKNVLLVVLAKRQLRAVEKAVKFIDPKAFLTVSKTAAVYGEGFEEIKTGIRKQNNKEINGK